MKRIPWTLVVFTAALIVPFLESRFYTFVATDIVHAAGAPRMVEELGRRARDTGATFFSDPFVSDSAPADWITRVVGWVRAG